MTSPTIGHGKRRGGGSGGAGGTGPPAGPGSVHRPEPPLGSWSPAPLVVPSPATRPRPVPARPTNWMAVASLTLSLLWLGGAGSLLALWCGYRARRQLAEHRERGSALATTGILLGWFGVVASAVVVMSLHTSIDELRAGLDELGRMFGDGPLTD